MWLFSCSAFFISYASYFFVFSFFSLLFFFFSTIIFSSPLSLQFPPSLSYTFYQLFQDPAYLKYHYLLDWGENGGQGVGEYENWHVKIGMYLCVT